MNAESYDQLVRNSMHSNSSIQRYIQKFMQVVELSKQSIESEDIGRLAQIGHGIVQQYLLIYEEAKTAPETEKWIEIQRKRLFYPVQGKRTLKRGV